jgi:hypothetical protein
MSSSAVRGNHEECKQYPERSEEFFVCFLTPIAANIDHHHGLGWGEHGVRGGKNITEKLVEFLRIHPEYR